MRTLRVALYARVSTKLQDATMQLEELREYASRRGDLEIADEYVDVLTGSKDSRPALNEVMRLARQTEDRRCARLETGSLGPFSSAPDRQHSRTDTARSPIPQLSGQLRPDNS